MYAAINRLLIAFNNDINMRFFLKHLTLPFLAAKLLKRENEEEKVRDIF